ncbi:MAG: hypothetical protein Q8P90_04205 [bacterium]|nr:hypothetical protein [bacterium]
MTKYARLSNDRLRIKKQASVPKVKTLQNLLKNTVLVNTVMILTLCVLGLSYLGIMNSTAADTFTVHELSQRIEETQQQNRDTEVAISEVLSLHHISEMSEQYDLVTATEIDYIDTDSAVAFSR